MLYMYCCLSKYRGKKKKEKKKIPKSDRHCKACVTLGIPSFPCHQTLHCTPWEARLQFHNEKKWMASEQNNKNKIRNCTSYILSDVRNTVEYRYNYDNLWFIIAM